MRDKLWTGSDFFKNNPKISTKPHNTQQDLEALIKEMTQWDNIRTKPSRKGIFNEGQISREGNQKRTHESLINAPEGDFLQFLEEKISSARKFLPTEKSRQLYRDLLLVAVKMSIAIAKGENEKISPLIEEGKLSNKLLIQEILTKNQNISLSFFEKAFENIPKDSRWNKEGNFLEIIQNHIDENLFDQKNYSEENYETTDVETDNSKNFHPENTENIATQTENLPPENFSENPQTKAHAHETLPQIDNPNSVTVFVSKERPLPDGFIPKGLVTLNNSPYLSVTASDKRLRDIAARNVESLARDFQNTFGTKFTIMSAYRSYDYQLDLNKKKPDSVLRGSLAKAGTSEHQTGLAFDMFGVNNADFKKGGKYEKYYEWMKENAHKYGFTQSYQHWRSVDGYIAEEWHWRYVWENLATTLHKNHMSYTQYLKQNEAFNT